MFFLYWYDIFEQWLVTVVPIDVWLNLFKSFNGLLEFLKTLNLFDFKNKERVLNSIFFVHL